ncbi:MAG: magnetosome biogenesis CDF transporter MamM [Magnetococcales bacterium]|nr:magnetosome biogenesis CDF transporter MamM [Magnetococcales bacterium]
MRYSKCVVCNGMIGWVGLIANLALSSLKLFVGLLSGSHALLADALYSAKDVVTSILIIVGLKVSNKPLDQEHPFGHGKVEFLLSMTISLVLMILTCILFYFSAETIMEGEHKPPHLIALWVAVLSLAVNLFMSLYARCVAVEINSPMVMTLARHHKGDGLSSLAVVFAIIGSHYLDMPWLDPVVALGETLHLLYLGGEVFWDSFQGLMDSSAPKEVEERIRQETLAVPGVRGVEELRTRRMGQELWISMVIGVNPDLGVNRAKRISQRVEESLASSIPHLGDVGVHFKSNSGSLPEMAEIQEEMEQLREQQEIDPDKQLPSPNELDGV